MKKLIGKNRGGVLASDDGSGLCNQTGRDVGLHGF